jgi:hypothetical protein
MAMVCYVAGQARGVRCTAAREASTATVAPQIVTCELYNVYMLSHYLAGVTE